MDNLAKQGYWRGIQLCNVWKTTPLISVGKKAALEQNRNEEITLRSVRQATLSGKKLAANSILGGSSEPDGNQFRDSRLLHGNSIKHGSDTHGSFAVCDENELRLHTHLFH